MIIDTERFFHMLSGLSYICFCEILFMFLPIFKFECNCGFVGDFYKDATFVS